MSNKKKPKKLRAPNVPMAVRPLAAPTAARGGAELAGEQRGVRPAGVAPVTFDYSYVRKDLNRIGLLAGSFIVILVILSFIIH